MPRPDITLTRIGEQTRLSINYLRVATFSAGRFSQWLAEDRDVELVTGSVTWTGSGDVVVVHHLGHEYQLAPATVSLLRRLF